MADRSPVRVVLDSRLRLPPQARLVDSAPTVPLWLVTRQSAPREPEKALRDRGLKVIRMPGAGDALDVAAVLAMLAERGITRLMVEAGPVLSAAMVKSDLVDEAVLFRSPNALGSDAIDALEGMPLSALTASPRLSLANREMADADTVEHFRRAD
jgi:diaminohydroxyphosphoribosylaminopyrimidine deaminase/5-amino-6-(5-phosphoribosylamino)uracil reductase